jgi:hypothetical protein
MCNKCEVDGCCNNMTHEVKIKYLFESKCRVCKQHAQGYFKLMFAPNVCHPDEIRIKRV